MLKNSNEIQRAQRARLLKASMEMGLSGNTLFKMIDPMEGMTDRQKEIRAGQILAIMEDVSGENELLQRLERLGLL